MPTQSPAEAHVSYRPDIDGLRAVAVLLVLMNHVGISRLSGGYIGVDVFFVISGYLITTNILRDLADSRFSLARFYERRFRRIMPALLVMMVATSIFAFYTFFPSEMKAFVASQIGALFSVSNIVLRQQSGYFDPNSKLKPLLHTWSLGVEEQFYIVFPLLLLCITRWYQRSLKPLLWMLAIASFGMAALAVRHDTSSAFYLAPYRAWEFLLGSLLASGALPRLNTSRMRNAASAAGLLLILVSGIHYTQYTPFPGLFALPPCLGALLIIAAGEAGTTATGKLLAWTPIRCIGVISYSLYLWHWPIQIAQVTQNILVSDRYPSWIAKTAIIVVSILVAALSWRFVEQPYRRNTRRSSRVVLFTASGCIVALLLAFSIPLYRTFGWALPGVAVPSQVLAFGAAVPSEEQLRWDTCFMEPENFPAHFNAAACLAPDPTRRHVLLVGDSHAGYAYSGLHDAFPAINFSLLSITGCVPSRYETPRKFCMPSRSYIFDYLSRRPVDTVLLIGAWTADDAEHLGETTDWIKQHGMRAIVFGPTTEFDASLIRLLNLAHREHDTGLLARHRSSIAFATDQRMKLLAANHWHVPYISMYDDLCNPQFLINNENAAGCPVYSAPGISLLVDTEHLSAPGSALFAKAIQARGELQP
jgi:peptidoglycan/LPS O-acetylase OafA/YrhL